MSAAIAVFLVLAVAAVAWRQPTAFVVQPHVPAFGAPAQPVFLFLALAFLTLATGTTGTVLRDWESDPFRPDQLIELGNAAVAILWIVVAWRDTSVQLRPDGLWQRGITGWLVVPWDAAPTVPPLPPPPTAGTVPLGYGRPELVRRRGLHLYRHRLHTRDIDPRLITAAIRHYVCHPEHRPAIGTEVEYNRLMSQLLSSPAAAVADQWK